MVFVVPPPRKGPESLRQQWYHEQLVRHCSKLLNCSKLFLDSHAPPSEPRNWLFIYPPSPSSFLGKTNPIFTIFFVLSLSLTLSTSTRNTTNTDRFESSNTAIMCGDRTVVNGTNGANTPPVDKPAHQRTPYESVGDFLSNTRNFKIVTPIDEKSWSRNAV